MSASRAAIWFIVAVALSGCVEGERSPVAGPGVETSCVAQAPPTGTGRPVVLWIGNEAGRDACIHLRLDDTIVYRGLIPASSEPSGEYESRASFRWPGDPLRVNVSDTVVGSWKAATYEATDPNHLIVSVHKDSLFLQHQSLEPAFG